MTTESESLAEAKLSHLQQIGTATLHQWLMEVSHETPGTLKSAEDLCQALSEELDSPFEDLQPSAPILSLINDWLEQERGR